MTVITTRDQMPPAPRPAGPMPVPPSPLMRPRPTAAAAAGGMTGRDVLRVIRKRKWLIVICVASSLLLALTAHVLWLMYAPLYTARAWIQVQPAQSDLQGATNQAAKDVIETMKMTYAQMATSNTVLQRALDNSKVKQTAWYRDHIDNLTTKLQSAIKVNPLKDTSLIQISMTGSNPGEVAEIVNAVAQAFEKDSKENASVSLSETVQRLESQQTQSKNDLEMISRELNANRRPSAPNLEQRLLSLTSDLQILTSQANALENEKRSADAALQNFRSQKDQGLLDNSPQISQWMDNDPTLKSMTQEMVALSATADSMLDKFGPKYRGYTDIQNRIASLRKESADREKTLRDQGLRSMEASYAAAVADMDKRYHDTWDAKTKAEDQARELQATVSKIEDLTSKEKSIQGDIAMLDRLLMDRRLQIRASAPILLRQYASKPDTPSMPQLTIMVMAGLVLGLMTGFGLALILEFVDTSIKSPSDLAKRLDLPLLGIIPHTDDLDEEIADLRLAFMTNPNSLIGEAFRQIRTSLQFSGPAGAVKTLLVTSALPGDGRGMVAMNLAAAIAHGGRKVLVVDANFRQPMIRKLVPTCPPAGLSNALVGQANWLDLVHDLEPNLSVMSAGPLPPNPTELFGSDAMRRLLAEMNARYDQIIFDGAPCLLVSDPAVLATQVDGVILVVRAGSNSYGTVLRARECLTRVGARVMGVVLNGIRVTAGGYLRKHYRTFYEYHEQGQIPPAPQA